MMKTVLTLILFVLFSFTVATAADRPGPPWDFEYSYDSFPNENTTISDRETWKAGLDWNYGDPLIEISYLELEIAGLTYNDPGDLYVTLSLKDQLGEPWTSTHVMMAAGADYVVDDLTMIFSDFTGKEVPLPHGAAEGQLLSGPGTIYQPDDSVGFIQYDGLPLDGAFWIITFLDRGGVAGGGSFDSVTLRGMVTPEPATLSLLVLGGLIFLGHKRRRVASGEGVGH